MLRALASAKIPEDQPVLSAWVEVIAVRKSVYRLAIALSIFCGTNLWSGGLTIASDPAFHHGFSPAPLVRSFPQSDSNGLLRLTPPPNPIDLPSQVTPAHFMVQNRRRSRFDQALVSRNRTAFESACTVCHDAQRSLQKKKSLSGWRATVRRMSAKDGADVPSGDFKAIATYLASLSRPSRRETSAVSPSDSHANREEDAEGEEETFHGEFDDAWPAVTVSGTISTLFRGADYNHSVENEGFFVDAWVGADWQPTGPISGRVMACTSCHSEDTALDGAGFTFEVVEASATLDLIQAVCGERSECGWNAKLKGGRFIVPFGAFAAMSHPGAYRTLTNPLMYNMGRRVFGDSGLVGPPRQPVLPMPYADEGVDLQVKAPLIGKTSARLDFYGVNGLQQTGPDLRFFTPSRSYVDNNSLPAIGGRVSVGNPTVKVGGSFMTGEAQPDGTTSGPILYQLSGADLTAKFKDLARFYLEYAIRTNTRKNSPFAPPAARRTMVYGVVAEAEVKLCDKPRIGLLGRYDTLDFRDTLFPAAPEPETSLERFTWGFNFSLPGGSLLILNHEHWNLPDPDDNIDVIGFRWVGTF